VAIGHATTPETQLAAIAGSHRRRCESTAPARVTCPAAPEAESVPTAYLAIVERGRAGVYETLKAQFETEARAEIRVLWDRRQTERRQRVPRPPDATSGASPHPRSGRAPASS
jgi:hypothetical protein